MALHNWYTQAFPPKPQFTEADVPALNGRVYIVTGGNQGVGFELCKILYARGGTVYMTSKSEKLARKAIETIEAKPTNIGTAPGKLNFLCLDLEDLATIKPATELFAAHEARLDVLWNQADIGGNPSLSGAETKQGIEQSPDLLCAAQLLLMNLLLPQLRAASKNSPAGSVRVIWTTSWLPNENSPKGGVDLSQLDATGDSLGNLPTSNWLLATEMARRYGSEGIISVAQNPSNLWANAHAGTPWYVTPVVGLMLHEPRLEAYTELYAGLSPDITLGNNGGYVMSSSSTLHSTSQNDGSDPGMSEARDGGDVGRKLWERCEELWAGFV